jgi:lipoate-protein ligase A
VTAPPAALFDTDVLRGKSTSSITLPQLAAPLVVLGSRQPTSDLDERSLRRDGIEVRRRRGGGGAVLLRPEDVWCEAWLPRRASDAVVDVRRTAVEIGAVWQSVLHAMAGLVVNVHEGGLLDADQGSIACFAAIGPGEVCVEAAKLVGISQWRVREGTLVSMVLAVRPPTDLAAYLADERHVPQLERSTCLTEVAPTIDPRSLAASFVRELARVASVEGPATLGEGVVRAT